MVGFTLIGIDEWRGGLGAFDAATGIADGYRGQGLARAMFDGDTCIGAAAYTPMLNWILTIVVEPSYRRQGVGRALMQGLVESLPEGVEAVRLQNVDGEDSGMASFLERAGFEPLVDQYEMTREV